MGGENDYKSHEAFVRAVPANTEVIAQHPGGGGWGDPLEREPERVHWDVVEGLVSREAAERDYAVVVSASGALDAAASARLRAERRAMA